MGKKLILVAIILLALISISGCDQGSIDIDKKETALPTRAPTEATPNPPPRSHSFYIHEVPLNIETNGMDLYVSDVSGNLALFQLSEKIVYEIEKDAFDAYFLTREIGIYDMSAGKTVVSWTPEFEGYCMGGVITGQRSAICPIDKSRSAGISGEYDIVSFDSKQTLLGTIKGSHYAMNTLSDGKVLISYDDTGLNHDRFGVKLFDGKDMSDLILYDRSNGRKSVNSHLYTYENSFCWPFIQDHNLTFVVSNMSAGTEFYAALDSANQKLDGYCMSQYGLLAEVSPEGQHYNQLLLYDGTSWKTVIDKLDTHLFRMVSGGNTAICVNLSWKVLAVVDLETDSPKIMQVDPKGIAGFTDHGVMTFASGPNSYVLFDSTDNALYRIIID